MKRRSFFATLFTAPLAFFAVWKMAEKPKYVTTGLMDEIHTNIIEYGSELSEKELYSFMEEIHKPPTNKERLLIDLRDGKTKTARQYLRERHLIDRGLA